MNLADLHFLRPWWLLALLALPLLWRVLRASAGDAQAWRQAVDAHLLEHLLVPATQGSTPSRSPRWLALVAWTLACVALAGPAWERLPQPLFQNKAARVIAVDLGASMLAQDVKPSRFERARFRIDDILKRSADLQTALVAYAGDAFVVAPLTDDANTVSNLVDALDPSVMPAPGNDTGRALDLAVKLMQQAGVHEGEIVLIADAVSANGAAAAARAKAAGLRVTVLGIGTAEGAPVPLNQGDFLKDAAGNIVLPKLDAGALAEVARAGGGRYVNVSQDGAALDRALIALKDTDASATAASEVQTARFLDRGPWFVLLLLPFGALAFRRGWLMLLVIGLGVSARPAQASLWDDLWQRPDQQAQHQLDAGDAKAASALAQDPDLRGSAAYRAGDYAGAAEAFARGDDAASADADYNRGNALAKQAKYDDALAAYAEALKRDPQMADALANKQAIEEFQRRQKQQDDSKQNKSDKDHKGHEQQQPGNDQAQQSDSKDGQGDQQGDEQNKNGQTKDGEAKDGQQQGDQRKSKDKGKQDGDASQGQARDDKDAAQAQPGSDADAQSQQQYAQSMDKALGAKGQDDKSPPQPVRLGAPDGKPRNEASQAVEQWLQRVPDDPGGLLRRKFQLEYQRRRNGAQENP